MPILEYRCTRCDTTFETRLSREEADRESAAICPQCGKATRDRLLSAFAVGSGADDVCETCPSPDGPGCSGSGCGLPE